MNPRDFGFVLMSAVLASTLHDSRCVFVPVTTAALSLSHAGQSQVPGLSSSFGVSPKQP